MTVAAVLSGARCWCVEQGNCLDVLRAMPDDSCDALVTDPPAGIGFMGKTWDADKGGRNQWVAWLSEVMIEALRVCKPGAHAVVWALPRTAHWTATALELAGWEIRDVIVHLFGTGFPKSLNVAIAIDKEAGAMAARGRAFVTAGAGDREDIKGTSGVYGVPRHDGITDAAKLWAGWGTALKPAAEHWILCRKPLDGTVAANVTAHGTGGLNVDGCRIGTGADKFAATAPSRSYHSHSDNETFSGLRKGTYVDPNTGRWPANVILDDEAAALLDEQSADADRTGAHVSHNGASGSVARGKLGASTTHGHADAGGASRFFYTAKPTRRERDAGCDALPLRTAGEATDREDDSAGLNSPRAGAGRTSGARNHHPTVKARALMSYLCRLVTPPGGVVVDPFAGSGSTGVACMAEGFRFVGVELEADYVKIARARLAHALHDSKPKPKRQRRARPVVEVTKPAKPTRQLPLFAEAAE